MAISGEAPAENLTLLPHASVRSNYPANVPGYGGIYHLPTGLQDLLLPWKMPEGLWYLAKSPFLQIVSSSSARAIAPHFNCGTSELVRILLASPPVTFRHHTYEHPASKLTWQDSKLGMRIQRHQLLCTPPHLPVRHLELCTPATQEQEDSHWKMQSEEKRAGEKVKK